MAPKRVEAVEPGGRRPTPTDAAIGMKPRVMGAFEPKKKNFGAVFEGKTDAPEFGEMQEQSNKLGTTLVWKKAAIDTAFRGLEEGEPPEQHIMKIHGQLTAAVEASKKVVEEIEYLLGEAKGRERHNDLLKHKEAGGTEEDYTPSEGLEKNLAIWDNTASKAKAAADHVLSHLEEEGVLEELQELLG